MNKILIYLKDMTITKRMTLFSIATMIAMLIIGLAVFPQLTRLTEIHRYSDQYNQATLHNIKEMQYSVARMLHMLNEMIHTAGTREQEILVQKLAFYDAKIFHGISQLKTDYFSDQQHVISIDRLYRNFMAYREKTLEYIRSGDHEQAWQRMVDGHRDNPTAMLMTQLDQMSDLSSEKAQSISQEALQIYHDVQKLLVDIIGTTLFLLLLGSLILTHSIITPIRRLQQCMVELSAGVLDKVIPYQEQKNEIGEISRGVTLLQSTYRQMESQRSIAANIATLSVELKQALTFVEFTEKLLSGIAPLLGMVHGVLFLVEEDQQQLRWIGGYGGAYPPSPSQRMQMSHGLVGQCVQSKNPITIADPPEDYIRISSGLGESKVRMILLQPVMLAGQVVGIIELAAFKPFNDDQQTFFEGLMPIVAMGLRSMEHKTQTQLLLESTQMQATVLKEQTMQLETQHARLEATEAWYHSIIESAPDGILIVDQHGTIVLTNAEVDRLFGYNTGELVGQPVEILVPVALRDRHVALRNDYLHSPARGRRSTHITGVRKDGSELSVELGLSLLPVMDERGQCVCTTLRDTTERKQYEKRILFKRYVVENSGPMFWIDPATGQITYANKAGLAHIGYSADEFIGMSVAQFDSRFAPAEILALLDSQRANSNRTYIESRHQRKDGCWVDVAMTVVLAEDEEYKLLIVTIHDITDQKKANQVIHHQRATMKALIDAIPDLIFYKDPQGGYLGCNSAFAELVGQPPDAIINKTDHQLFASSRANIFNQQDQHMLAVLEPISYEEWVDYPDGRRILLDVLKSPFWDEQGQLVGILGVSRDITERRAAEDSVRAAKEMAEEATRMKSDFLANMSHEIRTPMNAIIGMSYLAMQTEMTVKQQDYLNKIYLSANNLLGIINDILDFSKIEAGKLEMEQIAFKLDDVLDNLTNMVNMKAEEKNLELLLSRPEDVPNDLIGDPLRLSQILINLTNNAVKFTGEGEITIGVARICQQQDRVQLQFTVRDSGIGMTKEQVDKLFIAFSQADSSMTRKYGGTGLGLSICKHLVEMMNGTIEVSSVPHIGSQFTFTVWLGFRNIATATQIPLVADWLGMRVLVVDDHAQSRQILTETLTALGFDSQSVSSGALALAELERAAMEEAAKPYQLVLMDWKMPNMDGIATTRLIRTSKILPFSPRIIMISAYGRQQMMQQEHPWMIDGFLLKPTTPSLLWHTIQNVFQQQQSGQTQTNQQYKFSREAARIFLGARILLVEDNNINQQLAVELLESHGMVVTLANTGKEAVAMVGRKDFDLVLMDIQMPVMDGFQATALIRQDSRFQDLPILAMTAHAMAGDRDKSLAAGMNDHITKPIDPEQLFETLAKWLSGRKQGETGVVAQQVIVNQDGTELLPASLPGIDLQRGLASASNNSRLLLKLLREFRRDYLNVMDTIRSELDQGRQQEVLRLVHTIKGIAGSLGAAELYETSRDFETLLKQKQFSSNDQQLLFLLETAFMTVLQSISILPVTDIQETIPITTQDTDPVIHKTILMALCSDLVQLLTDGLFDAVDKIDEIDAQLGNAGQKLVLRNIKAQVENYEFEQALQSALQFSSYLTQSGPISE
ncbi:MAG: PAS domain S-box protein [Magnetococcales bacterium]|nr:PAS domain S-box protein [Magnetococcales bacterium]